MQQNSKNGGKMMFFYQSKREMFISHFNHAVFKQQQHDNVRTSICYNRAQTTAHALARTHYEDDDDTMRMRITMTMKTTTTTTTS